MVDPGFDMTATSQLRGTLFQVDKPNLAPLERLLDEVLVRRFMWMWEIELKDGTRVHAYKDRVTHRYLHLTDDARAFRFCAESSYLQVDPKTALIAAFTPPAPGQRLDKVEQLALLLALARLRKAKVGDCG